MERQSNQKSTEYRSSNQVEELQEIAMELQKLASDKLGGCMEHIAYNWKGENSKNFVRCGRHLAAEMEETAKRLRSFYI